MAFAHSFAQIMINIYSMGPLLVTELNKDSTKLKNLSKFIYIYFVLMFLDAIDFRGRELSRNWCLQLRRLQRLPRQISKQQTPQDRPKKSYWEKSIRKFCFVRSMCVIYSPRKGCWYLPQKPPRLYCFCSDGIALYQGVRRVCLMFACRDLGWCRLAMSPLVLYPLAGLLRFCEKIRCLHKCNFQTCPWLCKAYSWGAGCWLLELLWAKVLLVVKWQQGQNIFCKSSKSVKRKNCSSPAPLLVLSVPCEPRRRQFSLKSQGQTTPCLWSISPFY